MAFTCTSRPSKSNFSAFVDGNSRLITQMIGHDDDKNETYSAVVGLEPLPTGEMEYVFYLVAADNDDGTERPIWESRDVANFINRDDRAKILEVVLDLTKYLVNMRKPRVIFMSTHGDQEGRALEKYYAVNNVFTECGYTVTDEGRLSGTHAWGAELI